MENIAIHKFTGMNTFDASVSEGVATPAVIKDAVPHASGRLIARDGETETITLTDGSNIWTSEGTGVTYCIDNGYLCVVNWNTANVSILTAISHPEKKVFYENFGLVDFIGNEFWHLVVENGAIREWGESVDSLDALDWQPTENGLVLYRGDDVIPHPSEFVHKPNLMKGFRIAHGAMWGYYGTRLVKSEPLAYEWFNDDENDFEFDTPVTMYAPVSGGAFIGTEDQTLFLSTSGDAQVVKAYEGIQENSLVYASKASDMPNDTPMWLDNKGYVVAGMPNGDIVQVTKEKIATEAHGDCRTGILTQDGIQTTIFRIKGE